MDWIHLTLDMGVGTDSCEHDKEPVGNALLVTLLHIITVFHEILALYFSCGEELDFNKIYCRWEFSSYLFLMLLYPD